MIYTSEAFDRRLAAFERAEQGRFGQPLGDSSFARIALARRLDATNDALRTDPATLSTGGGFLLQR